MKFLAILFFACSLPALAQSSEAAKPLTSFVGHWEGGGSFRDTAMSTAGTIHSKTDCAWSPQTHYLICEQTITDERGTHQQLTVYTPSESDGDFAYYTITGDGTPSAGKVKIEGATWTYDNSFEQDGKKMEVRTTNTFDGDKEHFKTEFSIDGGPWTAMLEGESHRSKS